MVPLPASPDRRLAAGRAGEALALGHLEAHGLRLIERNYRCQQGEIDLVMRHDDTLVVVEVRTRSVAGGPVSPLESIDWRKRRQIVRVTRRYLAERPADWQRVRFDAVGVYLGPEGPRVEWVPDAFDAADVR